MRLSNSDVSQRQALTLEQKEILSLRRISDFCLYNDYKVYVAFSGGIDSTVLLHLVRRFDNSIEGVFSNTGLEYPETLEFVISLII